MWEFFSHSKLHWNVLIIWENWFYYSALGFGKEMKMGYFMQDYCRWLCLWMSTTQGPIKMKPLPNYWLGK